MSEDWETVLSLNEDDAFMDAAQPTNVKVSWRGILSRALLHTLPHIINIPVQGPYADEI